MEIRNALQKIENYLTVVSNLNKTILSEGTMSRDELLLMKKYLYTSIDRIEDIERSLIIDKREDKSFTPQQMVENKFVPVKEKEIVEVTENDHIEEVEAALSTEQKEEMENLVEDIHAEIEKEDMVFVGEITPLMQEEKNATEILSAESQEKVEIVPVVESIITEDYSVNKLVEVEQQKEVETVVEKVPLVESIITEDYTLNKIEENKVEEVVEEKIIEPVAETKSFAESIITEDYTLNKLFQNKTEESITEKVPLVESIITEDYSVNKLEETKLPVQETVVVDEKTEVPLIDKVVKQIETLAAKFEEQTSTTFAEELVNRKKDETSFFEKLEQNLNATEQPQLFEMFDDGKEELHESFVNNTTSFEPANTNFEKSLSSSLYEQHDSVLVVEKEVETVVENLTPSSLNDVFKPQTVQEIVSKTTNKSLSESIALNDKFIFVRELFGNHFGEYEAGLKQLEALNSFTLAENHCKEKFWNKFNWSDKTVAVERFMELLQKRFN